MSALKNRAWLLLAASITLQLVIVRSARVLKHDYIPHGHASHGLLFKRDGEVPHESLLSMPYADWYDNASLASRPFVIVALLLILAFLFSFIGITASDFFCPNLSTIASYLGLNESTAGVTFLAFGNGSPDVFSTFAALRGGTFSLAIGELIGAATFIVSIVVGTIALIKPFHVPRQAFLRDVLFFTAAVITLVVVLHDGHLSLYESGAMVALYILYVTIVVLGNWWNRRRRQKETRKALGWERSSSLEAAPTARIPSIHLPEPVVEPDNDDGSRPSSLLVSPASATASPSLSPQRIRARRAISSHLVPQHDHSEIDTPRANFSLLGAIEFRDVVNSLRKESGSRGTSPTRTPLEEEGEDYFGTAVSNMYGHRRSSSVGVGHARKESIRGRNRSISHVGPHRSPPGDLPSIPVSPDETDGTPKASTPSIPNPWSDQLGRPPSTVHTPALPSPTKPLRPRIDIPRRQTSGPRIPSISIIDPSGLPGAPPTNNTVEPTSTPPPIYQHTESRFRLRRRTRTVLRVLFPSLQSFRHKSYLGMFLAITCVPAIFALTITLPVVDDGPVDEGAVALPTDDADELDGEGDMDDTVSDHLDGNENHLLSPHVGEELHHLVEGGFSPLHSPLGRIHHSALRRMASHAGGDHEYEDGDGQDDEANLKNDEELLHGLHSEEMLEFHKGLTAVQCVLGPALCAVIIFSETDYFKWILLGSVLGGLVAAGFVLAMAQDGSSRTWRLVRCFAGFICSMVWIAAIADEVVSVLQAIGEILGLSDAIIGLTIFAVGNSLADLVANVTVAQFAPAMAYAACFGGPMLNLLLGVGGSGTYHMISQSHHSRVTLHFSPTLWVSAAGLIVILVSTAIIVPLNGYLIDRRWAICLIIAYIVLMSVNVAVEVKTGRD